MPPLLLSSSSYFVRRIPAALPSVNESQEGMRVRERLVKAALERYCLAKEE